MRNSNLKERLLGYALGFVMLAVLALKING